MGEAERRKSPVVFPSVSCSVEKGASFPLGIPRFPHEVLKAACFGFLQNKRHMYGFAQFFMVYFIEVGVGRPCIPSEPAE